MLKIYLDNCCYGRPFDDLSQERIKNETEIFIVNIKNKGFDYTEWRENLWEDMTAEELFAKAAEFERQHPEFIPKNAKRI
jgi:hypothetical protein